MAIVYHNFSTFYTTKQMEQGIPLSDITDGSGGVGIPDSLFIGFFVGYIAGSPPLPVNTPTFHLQFFPSGEDSDGGTDDFGRIAAGAIGFASLASSLVNYGTVNHGVQFFSAGLMQQKFRGVLLGPGNYEDYPIHINGYMSGGEPDDFPNGGPPPGPLTDVEITDANYDDDTNIQDITFRYTLPGDEDGTIITSTTGDGETTVLTTIVPGTTRVTVRLPPILPGGSTTVRLTPVLTVPPTSGPPTVIVVTVPFSTLTMVGSGQIDLGGTAPLQFIGNPSGIYTLVNNQFRDILYERIPTPSTNPVKIPKPFIKGPFIGG